MIDTVALISLVSKVWRHYSMRNPRRNHVAMDGTKADSNGYFALGGVLVFTPRDFNLPASESMNCRCEAQYEVG